MRHIILLVLIISVWSAEPPVGKPLPSEVQKVLDSRESAAAKAKDAYDVAIAKVNTEAIKAMEKAVSNRTKAGDLEGAMAGKKIMDGWKVTDKADSKVEIISVKYGIEGNTIDLTKFLKSKVVDGAINFANNDSTNAALEDPAPGSTKSFFVTYRVDGKVISEVFPKHSPIKIGG